MLELNNPLWKTFEGALSSKYDASIALKKLENETNSLKINQLVEELFENLYHQGDVGVASYMALPHLIRIAIQKKIDNFLVPLLVASVETNRNLNVDIPIEFEEEYLEEIKKVIDLIYLNQNQLKDKTYLITALAAICATQQQTKLSEVILEMEDNEIVEKFSIFLDKYDEFEEYLQKHH